VDFRLSTKRDVADAKAFFRKAIKSQLRPPQTITLDGYAAASRHAVHELKADGFLPTQTKLRSSKYFNNLIEQDHRGVKQRIAAMLGFKQHRNAVITIAGIELMHHIHKGQFQLRRLGVKGETGPQSGTRYSEPDGSASHPTRMSACHAFAPRPAITPQPVRGGHLPICTKLYAEPNHELNQPKLNRLAAIM
jgi:hypothetical protein